MSAPPNLRHRPEPGDRRERQFSEWFDGGAVVVPTGGPNEYHFDDGVQAMWFWHSATLQIKIRWPDGRVVRIEQELDQSFATTPEG
jgi:hypothetical protein